MSCSNGCPLRFVGPTFSHGIAGYDFIRDGMTEDVEPTPTPMAVYPTLRVKPLGIDAIIEILRPAIGIRFRRLLWAGNVGFAATAKFNFRP
jgi:hypothetical protein